MRTLPQVAVIAALLGGCIIYEERYVDEPTPRNGCEQDCEDPGATEPDPEPEPEPEVTPELFLTLSEGYAGDSLLTTLESRTGQDLSLVSRVQFARDIEVIDAIERADEVVLLLQIAADAEAGLVDCFVETEDGGAWILEEPFKILATSGGTGCAATDTGSDPLDTGCP